MHKGRLCSGRSGARSSRQSLQAFWRRDWKEKCRRRTRFCAAAVYARQLQLLTIECALAPGTFHREDPLCNCIEVPGYLRTELRVIPALLLLVATSVIVAACAGRNLNAASLATSQEKPVLTLLLLQIVSDLLVQL